MTVNTSKSPDVHTTDDLKSGDKLRLFFVVVLVALAGQMLLSALGIHLLGRTA